MLGGDVLVTEVLGLGGGGLEAREQAARGLRLTHRTAGGRRKPGQSAASGRTDGLADAGIGVDGGEQTEGDAVLLAEELGEQVKRVDLGVASRGGGLHRCGNGLLGAGGVIRVHVGTS